MEKITLTSPVFADAGAVEFAVWSIYLVRKHPDAPAQVRVVYREVSGGAFVPNGREWPCIWADTETTTTTEDMIKALNKANLLTKSLERRCAERSQTDGKFGAGAISGVPD